ncbi:MAG: plastocyanin/azurin family copper-binding protein [Actinomycetota bacterium]|nr:plastocyanin/azurin family copper-binding protein [Actinomycetota bacterium]
MLLVVLAVVIGVLAGTASATAPIKTAKIVNYAFRPGRLTIHKGTRVVWLWSGGFIGHNVVVINGPVKFHSRTKASGGYAHLFTRAGTYHLECTLHPAMTETIVVQ